MDIKDKVIYNKLSSILLSKPEKKHIHLWDGAEGIETCYDCGAKGYRTSKGRIRIIRGDE